MDIINLGITSVAGITVICYLFAQGFKCTPIDNKWIPTICGFTGGALGIAAMNVMPEFPANDPITAVAIGIVSGFAATGVNQAVRQLTTAKK